MTTLPRGRTCWALPVDPDERRLVWELADDRYVEVADVGPGESWWAARTFEVTVVPGELTD